ncbi:transcription factor cwo isoform X2 [Chrysoperla carnea]|uniref:transcription factor cwo isoform X2 n=1 Tax=Chrysoperla carnea TaxID=189513 RepID=UPI001D061E1F|nr:transcription factor cwo isoform X2 [Chrysoperla carnea]
MNTTQSYWEDISNMQPVKFESNSNDEPPRLKDEPNSLYRFCDGNLNFATVACSEDDSEYGNFHKKNKVSRQDPMSHRIIEKRRRDRMNNCLADLSRLIPADYLKKGRGRIEKTEIIEMAIKHMKYLQQAHHSQSVNSEHYRLGFQECMSETMRFLVEVEGFFAREALCVKLINHLQAHCEAILTSDRLHSGNPISQSTNTNFNPNIVQLPPPQLRSPITNTNQNINTSSVNNIIRPTSNSSPMQQQNGGQLHHQATDSQQNHSTPYDSNTSQSQLRDMLTTKEQNVHIISEPIPLTTTRQIHSPNHNNMMTSSTNHHDKSPMHHDVSDMYEYQQRARSEREENGSQNGSDYMISVPVKPPRFERTSNGGGGSVPNSSDTETSSRECSNGASLYKFKNNIMQRISQQSVTSSLSTHNINKLYKRRKLEMHQQHGGNGGSGAMADSSGGSGATAINTISSTNENYSFSENHSSSPTDGSQTSPPSSDIYTRISSESDNQHRISPTGSSVSDNKVTNGRQSPRKRYTSSYPKHLIQICRNSQEVLQKHHHQCNNNNVGNNIGSSTGSTNGMSTNNNNNNGGQTISESKLNLKTAISQMYHQNKTNSSEKQANFSVPIFVLHAKGSFYIPLTIDYNTLVPYLQNYNILDMLPQGHTNIVLHPVTINVNFQPASVSATINTKHQKYKSEMQNDWH